MMQSEYLACELGASNQLLVEYKIEYRILPWPTSPCVVVFDVLVETITGFTADLMLAYVRERKDIEPGWLETCEDVLWEMVKTDTEYEGEIFSWLRSKGTE